VSCAAEVLKELIITIYRVAKHANSTTRNSPCN